MKKYQVLFFGTPEIALPTLHSLAESEEIEVAAVVTQSDKPAGRHMEVTQSAVKVFAEKKGIPVLQPETLRGNKEFAELIRELKPDAFVIISYGQIIPKKILEIPKHGALNIHVSLLPKYRGASPIQQALLNNDNATGITIIKINERMDAGDIIFVKKLLISDKDNAGILSQKLGVLGGEFIVPVLLDYMEDHLKPIPQNHAQATFCSKIEKDDGRIKWEEQTAQEIFNRIRAFTPWPSCFTTWDGKRMKIIEARVGDEKIKPGTMEILSGEKKLPLAIGTKKGSIHPVKIQLEGKGLIDIKTFLNGNKEKILKSPRLEPL